LSIPEGIRTSADSPFYPYYVDIWHETFKVAKKLSIGVLFTGDSGDHLFGGRVFNYADLLLTGNLGKLIRQLYLNWSYYEIGLVQLIRNTIISPIAHSYFPHWRNRSSAPVTWLRSCYHDLYRQISKAEQEPFFMLPGKKQRLGSLRDRLLPINLEYNVRLASEFNIQERIPLLDHRLIEFAASLPTYQTHRDNTTKFVMRNAMLGYLPNSVINLRHKIVPADIAHRGLRERETAKVWKLLTNMRSADLGFVDERNIRQAYQMYLDGKTQDTSFWYTLSLEDWLRRYF